MRIAGSLVYCALQLPLDAETAETAETATALDTEITETTETASDPVSPAEIRRAATHLIFLLNNIPAFNRRPNVVAVNHK